MNLQKNEGYFKKATSSDIPTIIEIYHAGFKELYNRYHDDKTNPYKESAHTIQEKMKLPNSIYYFIIHNKIKIGIIRIVANYRYKAAEVSPLVILPEFQGQKLAQKSVQEIESLFPTIRTWYVNTIKQEPKLIHLYLKCGYQIVPHKIQTIRDGMDIVFFRKDRNN
ncbi:GNAT family N-acetyltransferase [Lentilactobacillus hilgardii]|nr:GNAT family N-acetyltransferase [Lentilactobacillus hilgardii]MCV3741462.1 GNAT family N-acetyltransferase [Lentilactobacillus hilgardii]